MLKVFERVKDTDLTAYEVQGSRERFIYSTERSTWNAEPPVRVPLYPDPGPEVLRQRLHKVIQDFRDRNHGWDPGHVLFVRKGSLVGLAAFPFAPPPQAILVDRFDFEEQPP